MNPLSNKKGRFVVHIGLAVCLIALSIMASSCAPYQAGRRPLHYKTTGHASWYGPGFAGRKTANGERFNPNKLTCAHKTLPFNTTLKVTHVENGKSVVVRVNDRGPFIRGRVIDLSKEAARRIGMLGSGTAKVEIVAIASPEQRRAMNKRIVIAQKETPPATKPSPADEAENPTATNADIGSVITEENRAEETPEPDVPNLEEMNQQQAPTPPPDGF